LHLPCECYGRQQTITPSGDRPSLATAAFAAMSPAYASDRNFPAGPP